MPDTPTEEFPGWLTEALCCPVCRDPCAMNSSGGAVCLAVPAHTGMVRQADTIDKIVAAHKLAVAHGLTKWSQYKAIVRGRKYLKQQLLWRSKR